MGHKSMKVTTSSIIAPSTTYTSMSIYRQLLRFEPRRKRSLRGSRFLIKKYSYTHFIISSSKRAHFDQTHNRIFCPFRDKCACKGSFFAIFTKAMLLTNVYCYFIPIYSNGRHFCTDFFA